MLDFKWLENKEWVLSCSYDNEEKQWKYYFDANDIRNNNCYYCEGSTPDEIADNILKLHKKND